MIRRHLLPRLFARRDVAADDVAAVLGGVRGHPMAKGALEMAILDAELRARRRLVRRVSRRDARPRSTAACRSGSTRTIPTSCDTVAGYLAEGYRRIKLKIEPGHDVEPVRAVRERFGDILLQVDANAAYTRRRRAAPRRSSTHSTCC